MWLPDRPVWHALLLPAPGSCSVHSFLSIELLYCTQPQAPSARSFPSIPLDSPVECFQLDRSLGTVVPSTWQGSCPPGPAKAAPHWLLCHSLSHIVSSPPRCGHQPWSGAGDSSLGDLSPTGGGCSLYVLFLYSVELSLFLPKQAPAPLIPWQLIILYIKTFPSKEKMESTSLLCVPSFSRNYKSMNLLQFLMYFSRYSARTHLCYT